MDASRLKPGSKLRTAVEAALARDARVRVDAVALSAQVKGATLPEGTPYARLFLAAKSHLVLRLLRSLWVGEVLPSPATEWPLIPDRRFRADLAWPSRMLYVEVDGGAWVGGRHARGGGIRSDAEKSGLAAALGWRLIRTDDEWIRKGQTTRWIRDALAWEAA